MPAQTRWRVALVAAGVLASLPALIPQAAAAFGTVNILHQRAEHERITRLALGCRPGQAHDGSCFDGAALTQVAGTNSTFGAVGAADDLPLHLSGGPSYWHCDDADFLDTPGYLQSRAGATARLDACRAWARDMLTNGRPSGQEETWPTWGAVSEARTLLDRHGNVDASDPGTGVFHPPCAANGRRGRVKCNVYEPFGYVLHVTEDFYSHSNWADQSDPNRPISITNPPGLAHRDLPDYWNLSQPSAALPDNALATGCYPTKSCHGRITHDDGLNKDKEDINTTTGYVSDPLTPRGRILDNAQRAVTDAVSEARRQWAIFRALLVKTYGGNKGARMICALTSDSADRSCNRSSEELAPFQRVEAAPNTLASIASSQMCLDDPGASTTDGTPVQMHPCNGSAAQQFLFHSRDIQFQSVGLAHGVSVVGKCLWAPNGADGTLVRIATCDHYSPNQEIHLYPSGSLVLLGKCISGLNPSKGTPVTLEPCDNAAAQRLWQVR